MAEARLRSTDRTEEASTGGWPDLGWGRGVWLGLIAGLLLVVFRHEVARLVRCWSSDPSWSHGFLIPLFSLYFVYQRRSRILAIPARPSAAGCVALVFWIGVYVFNMVSPSGYAYVRSFAMVMALGSVVWFLGGWGILLATWLPVVYLLLAVPLPDRTIVSLTLPLRFGAARVSAALLDLWPGVDAVARGAVIDIVHRGRVLEPALDVADACSGMHLLMAFVALGVGLAYLHPRPLWHRVVLLVSTIPIAILCNLVRVTVTGFIYVLMDPRYAQGAAHDLLGLAMLPLALGLYGLLAWFMSSLFVEEGQEAGQDIVVRGSGVRGQETEEKPEAGSRKPEAGPVPINAEGSRKRDEERVVVDGRRVRVALVGCAVILALCGAGLSATVKGLGLVLHKDPLPLRRPFDQMDESALAPFRVVAKPRIEDPEVLRRLGTTDTVQWVLEDAAPDRAGTVRSISVFVTYYGLPDRVPHVPEECYLGGGFQRLSADQVDLALEGPGAPRAVAARVLVFGPTGVDHSMGLSNVPVLYLFRVNGRYAADRDEVRVALNRNLFGRHSYFSKVELSFTGDAGGPSRTDVLLAGQRLLSRLLPVLERDHWPQDSPHY